MTERPLFRVLVCGGRDFAGEALLCRVLDNAAAGRRVVLVHGMAQGADMLADAWARRRGHSILGFRADWDKHGRAAGPIRNQRMIDKGMPELVVAFPGGRGTADMVRRAREANIEVIEA